MTRLRWRLRGATMWPAFIVATVVETALWSLLPAAGDGPDYVVGSFLIAMALNLIVVAGLAPAVGFLWRRRRPDLPRPVAADGAGTILLALLLVGTVVVGLVHRRELVADDRDRDIAYVAMSTYIHNQEPALAPGLQTMEALEVEEGKWRTCVPTGRKLRSLCLFVDVDQNPAGVTKDGDQLPNALWRR